VLGAWELARAWEHLWCAEDSHLRRTEVSAIAIGTGSAALALAVP